MRPLFPARTSAPLPVRPDLACVHAFAWLIALQCAGEWIADVARLPIPGPVIGLVLLLCLLSFKPSLRQEMEGPALGLLNHLSLLFVPAGAGVFALGEAMKGQWVAIAVAIIVSTALSIATAGLVTSALLERRARSSAQSAEARQ
jgi:holin-like protein